MSSSACGNFFVMTLVVVRLVATGAGQSALSPAPAPLHVLKIASGPAGMEANGGFTLSEERSVFSRATDREVVVFFQWDGVPGPHKLVAQWRSPDGGLTSTSAIDYLANARRFGAYWRLTLTPSMPLGTWSIEASVDGQPAGRLTFDVRDEKVTAAAIKRPLTPAEIYDQVNRVFVVIERATTEGRQLDAVGGFMTGPRRLYTSLVGLDGADRLNAVAANGSRYDLTSVLAWHRQQEWAVLEGGPTDDVVLPMASADAARIGDRLFSIEGSATGGRAIAEGTITGQTDVPGVGRWLLAAWLTGSGTPGSPVLNEFGELIGLIGGARVPGATELMDILRYRAVIKGVPIVPIAQVRFQPGVAGETIAALQVRGDLIVPLVGREHVVSGGFAKQIVKGPTVAPADQRDQFSSQDKTFVAWVNWNPLQRVRGQRRWRVFDANNKVVIESEPAKIDLRKGELTLSSWQLPVPSTIGLYRVEALIDNKPIWRDFVRITP